MRQSVIWELFQHGLGESILKVLDIEPDFTQKPKIEEEEKKVETEKKCVSKIEHDETEKSRYNY